MKHVWAIVKEGNVMSTSMGQPLVFSSREQARSERRYYNYENARVVKLVPQSKN